jgi:dephospho-CoA kinase
MIKVGLTGGIGAGKSYVGRIFSQFGIPVFIADIEARKIQLTNPEVIKKMIDLLGKDIYLQNGDINRKKLAQIIFNDKIVLQKVNEIIHPAVRKAFEEWTKKQTSPYVIQEAAVIFENQQSKNFDKIISVTAPVELKIKRVMGRDNISREEVLKRMKNQLPDEEKIRQSDYVINTDNQQLILPQIIEIHNKLIS